MDGLARLGAAIPGLSIVQPAAPASAAPWLVVLRSAPLGDGPRHHRRCGGAASAPRGHGRDLGSGWRWQSLAARADDGSGLTLHFLDVGQGDGAIIHTPGGQWIVVDAGPGGDQGDAGRRVVVPALERAGCPACRAAGDLPRSRRSPRRRARGAGPLSRPMSCSTRAIPFPTGSTWASSTELAERGTRWRAARAGDTLVVDSVRVVVLHPSAGWPEFGLDLNEDSAVLRLEYGGCRVLMAGDAGLIAEAAMRGHAGPVDLLKVGHHGSRTATGEAWLDELAPEAAVISVGAHNRYGHPAPETVARLAAHADRDLADRSRRHGHRADPRRAARDLRCGGPAQQYACHSHPSP